MILERLDALRDDFTECEFLALADISSGTVLCVSTSQKIPQERLDACCIAATEFLAGHSATGFSAALGQPDDPPVTTAAVLLEGKTIFLLRLAGDDTEVLLCQCGPDIDVDRFLPALRAGLVEIAAT